MKKVIYSVLVALAVQGSASAFSWFKRSAPPKPPVPPVSKPMPPVPVPVAMPMMPVQQISASELAHIQNLGEAMNAVKARDISTLIYYLEAGLLRPTDYKFLLQEANLAVARQSKSWRSLGSWIKLIGGVAGGMCLLYFLYDGLRLSDAEQDEQSEKDIALEIKKLRYHLEDVPPAERSNPEFLMERTVGRWDWWRGLYEKSRIAREEKADNKQSMERFGPGARYPNEWSYNYYKGRYKAEKSKLANLEEEIRETKRKHAELQEVLKDRASEKSQDEFLARRWNIAHYGGYLLGAGLCFLIGYRGLVAPGKAYQEAKDIVALLKKYQAGVCPPKPAAATSEITDSASDGKG